jgi:hypothetical protein
MSLYQILWNTSCAVISAVRLTIINRPASSSSSTIYERGGTGTI